MVDRLWKVHGDGRTVQPCAVVRPDERLHMPAMLGLGAQHVLAMFGATALVPVLTGFPVSVAAIGIYQVLRLFQPEIRDEAGAFGDPLVEPLARTPDPRTKPA